MFNFLTKRNTHSLKSVCDGKCIDISCVKDDTFAKKMLGDGVAVIPSSNIICSPCDGKIVMIFDTFHAFGIKTFDNKEILIHIGINTVNLGGKGFKALKKVDSFVKAGEPIIEFEKKYLKDKNQDMSTMIIVTSKNPIVKNKINENVKIVDDLIVFGE